MFDIVSDIELIVMLSALIFSLIIVICYGVNRNRENRKYNLNKVPYDFGDFQISNNKDEDEIFYNQSLGLNNNIRKRNERRWGNRKVRDEKHIILFLGAEPIELPRIDVEKDCHTIKAVLAGSETVHVIEQYGVKRSDIIQYGQDVNILSLSEVNLILEAMIYRSLLLVDQFSYGFDNVSKGTMTSEQAFAEQRSAKD